jgi:transcriptional regulator with XRE-family HTH domain
VGRPLTTRDRAIRRARANRESLNALAARFGISRTRVVQILAKTGGDPIDDLGRRSIDELEAMRAALRVKADSRATARLGDIEDELESRRVDRILGIA